MKAIGYSTSTNCFIWINEKGQFFPRSGKMGTKTASKALQTIVSMVWEKDEPDQRRLFQIPANFKRFKFSKHAAVILVPEVESHEIYLH